MKNYRPVSLLPIFGKTFERLICNSLFKYIDENELFNPNQSGLRPFGSCVNQMKCFQILTETQQRIGGQYY